MKRLIPLFVFTLLLAFSVPSFGAAPTKQPKPTAPAAASATAAKPDALPTVAEVDQLKLKVIMQDLTIKQLTYQNAQNQLKQLETDFQKAQGDMQTLVQEIYKKAGLKADEYDLNPQTFTFSKKVPPPNAGAAPPAGPPPNGGK